MRSISLELITWFDSQLPESRRSDAPTHHITHEVQIILVHRLPVVRIREV